MKKIIWFTDKKIVFSKKQLEELVLRSYNEKTIKKALRKEMKYLTKY